MTNIDLAKNPLIICIGGANVDRKYYVKSKLTYGTSNPVKSSRTVGGVARNIAENLGRLGENVSLISVKGSDAEWMEIQNGSSSFMDLTDVIEIEGASTGSYTAVIDPAGDLSIALADMDIFEEITPARLKKNHKLKKATCIIVDLNCPAETIAYLCAFAAEHTIPLIIIPVSSPKMDRLQEDLSAVSWLIVNKDESETFLKMKISNEQDYEEAVLKWLSHGVKNVIITSGEKGVTFGNQEHGIRFYPAIDTPTVVDVTGAGDAFCSGVIYSWLQNQVLDDNIQSGLVNSHKTIQSTHTVRPELSQKQFKIEMEEII